MSQRGKQDGIDDNCNGLIDENCGPCKNAINLVTTNITSGSATLNWVASATPAQWNIEYKSTKPGAKWKDVLVAGTARSYLLTGLLPKQAYNWQIKAKCETKWTSYSGTVSFTTLAASSGSISNNISKAEPVNRNLKLYPNPSTGQFVVELHVAEKINANAKIQLLDLTGKTVYTENAVMNNGALQKTVTASTVLANGIYVVRIIVNNNTYKAQLVYEK